MASTETATEPTIGDRVRIYSRSITNVKRDGRIVIGVSPPCLQSGEYVIAAENRHGHWTVRHVPTGCTHDVLRADAELIKD